MSEGKKRKERRSTSETNVGNQKPMCIIIAVYKSAFDCPSDRRLKTLYVTYIIAARCTTCKYLPFVILVRTKERQDI